ncbi:MAM and LDL-receptor class A domain-containing protein 1-like isoform X2 [Haliotis rufescens]|uniref:MAM and LDL-receptor class A domain-containing protein 1-like isoform X2 n=1 Tax=Haliotis rufescens TaxID=6454 RepID=UPI00201EBD82|nr:MAM and LDL-receptor class A domain-containing protein 1-like isoform X2 [Haliotis rufescens]
MTGASVVRLLALAVGCSAVSAQLDCIFETDFCQWTKDQGLDKFDWMLIDQIVVTGPSGKGHYAYVDSSVGGYGDNAQLISPKLTIAKGQSKCLVFHYNMYGEHVNALNVYEKTNEKKLIWTRHGNMGTNWMETRINLPEATDFQVVIEAVRGQGEKGVISIDDTKIINGPCSLQASKPVTCSFDNDMCTWIQMKNDDFDWTRYQGSTSSMGSGPQRDHTAGNGFYLYAEASGHTSNKTARIQSKTITPRMVTKCLSFWYHMHGDHIGTLNAYIKSTPTIGSPVWTKTGAQGLNWNQAQITVSRGHTPYSVVIEAVAANGYGGDIAIDDVGLADGACTVPTVHSAVHPGQVVRKCDFEDKAICGYTQDKTDTFDWTWTAHTTTSYGTGPSNDHTYGTTSGHYLFTEASSRRQGDKARILTPVYYDRQAMCAQFYYHMYGATMGTFNAYAEVGNSTGRPLFSRQGNQGNKWIVGQATIPTSTATSALGYRMMFEGVLGASFRSDIALDDVSFTVGACSIPGDCTFESDLCTWENTAMGDQFDWTEDDGGTPSSFTGPSVDHTLVTPEGKYLYIETSAPRLTGDKAWLVSESFPPVTSSGRCIKFWYSMYGDSVGTLNVYIRVPGRADDMIWHQSGNHGDAWFSGQAPITEKTNSYTIVFEGIRGSSYTGDIAIDDIIFTTSNCGIFPSAARPTVTQEPTTRITNVTKTTPKSTQSAAPTLKPSGTTVGSSSNTTADKCNFETNDICGFTQDHSDTFDWTRMRGSTSSSGTGPASDHTYGTMSGYYMYIETSAPRRAGDDARLISSVLSGPTTPSCVTFWYYMYGSSEGTLNVYVLRNGARGSPIWHLSGNQGNSWMMAMVSLTTVSSNTPYQIVFEGIVGSSYLGDIAIDDFSLTAGACSTSPIPNSARPTLTQEPITRKISTTRTTLKSTPSNKSTPKPAGTTVGSSSNTTADKCNFETNDICGFTQDHSDTFDWTRKRGSTSFYGTGPASDHTYGTMSGYYMYIETSSPKRAGDDARLISSVLSGPTTPSCVTFWYYMYGSSEGTLNVYVLRNGARGSPIWHLSGNQGNSWMMAMVSLTTVSSNTPYQIVFEGIVGSSYLGDIAIDDFSLTAGACSTSPIPNSARPTVTQEPITRKISTTRTTLKSTPSNKSTPKPAGTTVGSSSNTTADKCNFETNDICGFTQDHSDTFDWTRMRGSTSSSGTGPASDHTYGTMSGYYMYIETSAPRRAGDDARLISSVLSGPTTPSCVTFWYYMYGSSEGTLNVYVLRNGARGSPIWHLSGNQGNSWMMTMVSLTTVSSNTPYQIVFEGIVGSSYLGDIAIDDFSLTAGACSTSPIPNSARPTLTQEPITRKISTTRTTLKSTPSNKSTPKPAGTTVGSSSNTTADKCNFETNDICGFTQDHSDTFDWTRMRGSTSSSGTGPASDHTYGTMSGYYMYIETSAPRRAGDDARLISSVLSGPTTPSCVTFWYYMYGSSEGTLKVYVLRNGARGSSIWHLSGNQGNSWMMAMVSLTTVSSNTPYQIVFEAIVGSGYLGDVAIDDFSLTAGACSTSHV